MSTPSPSDVEVEVVGVASATPIVITNCVSLLSPQSEEEPPQNEVYIKHEPDNTPATDTLFLESVVAGEELTVELDGKLYIISTVQDEETGQLLNVINLAEEDVVDNASSAEALEIGSYEPSDSLVGINETGVEMDLEGREVGQVEMYERNDVSYLEEPEYQVHFEKAEKQKGADATPGLEDGMKKSKPGNKDVMELPFTYSGQTFTVQAQKLILNVFDFFSRTKDDPKALMKIGTPQEQAGKVLNVSPHVIGKVRKRFKTLGKIVIPGERRKKRKRILDAIDAEKEVGIRSIIEEFTSNKIPPTLSRVMAEVVRQFGFACSRTSFRRILNRMGLKSAKLFDLPSIPDSNTP